MDLLDELKSTLPNCLLYDQVRIGSRLAVILRQNPDRSAPSLRAELEQLKALAVKSADLCLRRAARRPTPEYPENLPVSQRRADIIEALKHHPVIVIAGETGSGKTTQIPKMCLDAGFGVRGRIGCTQPRRVAALSISRRVAEELKVPWGKDVGCKIRFDDTTSPETVVKFMTDGILLAEVQGDPHLTEYEVIVIDEAHERSLNIDFLLGHLRYLIQRRPDLKLIITSATIDTARFAQAFGGAPIIEVSGRVYPVETRYAPLNELQEDSGDQTFIDAAATAIEDILTSSYLGDCLVFLPGERDIRELKDLLITRRITGIEIIPLFGRLSGSDQQRAFSDSSQRKVVLATNIAETSITIPGIRYVIDSGRVRLSRYNPRTRTKRLPVEPVSQSSANQRKGRAGRIAEGICIRLYSEDDFNSRPAFTQPEIQRANLAEVILRMKAARLGEIETFPFLEPPSPAAIRSGYELLTELGALDETRTLTPLGVDLARLPVDPTIGRIILQSTQEGVLEEVLVIAAGLSIQDPRERPFEEASAATTAHKRFQHPTSDFITLLNLWNAFHDQWEKLRTQNQLRKFCKANYLSYLRMREWVDIHSQLSSTFHETIGARWMESDDSEPENPVHPESTTSAESTAVLTLQDKRYQGIHRAVLTGMLGHVAQKTEKNLYKATGNRQVAVFPASSLHEKNVVRPPAARPRADAPPVVAARSVQPEWIVAGEIVETSRLFARTLAGIDPTWIAELGAHLCKRAYDQPRWDPGDGQVVARERITFHGLEVANRKVAYGRIAPDESASIFIRAALVEGGLIESVNDADDGFSGKGRSPRQNQPMPIRRRWQVHDSGFLDHNQRVMDRIQTWQTRVRKHSLHNLDDALVRFYSERIPRVSSVAELNELLRDRLPKEPHFLRATEKDLVGDLELSFDASAFPERVSVGDHSIAVNYAYAPGEEHDGPTFRVPLGLLPIVKETAIAWGVPGLRAEQIHHLLRELPKNLRRDLQPFAPKVAEIVAEFRPTGDRFLDELAFFVSQKYSITIPAGVWQPDQLPNHLRPRVEIVGPNQTPLMAGRNLQLLEQKCIVTKSPDLDKLWRKATSRWEQYGITQWSLGSIPKRIEETDGEGGVVIAFPGLELEEGGVCLKLFRSEAEARKATGPAWMRLLEYPLSRELAWMQKDLRSLERYKLLYSSLGTGDELLDSALDHLKAHLFPPPAELTLSAYEAAIREADQRARGVVPAFVDRVGLVLQKRQELMVLKRPFPGQRLDLDRLLPRRFLATTPFSHLQHTVRYLRAMQLRAERASVNPVKDSERAKLVEPYQKALAERERGKKTGCEALGRFRWMLEEFKVSLFAQELGTAEPVSSKRLDALLSEIDSTA
jgi:ATP-dependent helicase HrpA